MSPSHLRRLTAATVAAIVVLGVARFAGDIESAVRGGVYPNELPNAPGHATVSQSCLMCHSATLITQQRKDSTGWAKTVMLMEQWGAPIPDGGRDSVLAYLIAQFAAAPVDSSAAGAEPPNSAHADSAR